jgi:hypothetical protein
MDGPDIPGAGKREVERVEGGQEVGRNDLT